jgi:hypothetical protein
MTDGFPQGEHILAELKRLGLNPHDAPSLFFCHGEEVDRFLTHLRSLAPGATWRQVFPNLPAHWVPGEPETYTLPYVPFGQYDYAELPTGPAIHVIWEGVEDSIWIEKMVAAARKGGWPVYGAGAAPGTNPRTSRHAFVVLERSVSPATVDAFVAWVGAQAGLVFGSMPRRGDKKYSAPATREALP